jgi:hypothetical protein
MKDLTEIMNRNGSDKGSGHHNYTEYYATLFDPIRNSRMNILEIGIGTNNPHIPSSMIGTPGGYNPGSSLRGWKEYFTSSNIYGCDIDREILFEEDRISTFHLDQRDQKSLQEQIVDKNRMYDIIIDDGLHHFETNLNVLKTIYSKLKQGGIYIIEDIGDMNLRLFYDDPVMRIIRESGSSCDYIQINNPKNSIDNNLVVLRKKTKRVSVNNSLSKS